VIQRGSELAQQLIGTFIPDADPPASPLINWLQSQCREGPLKKAIWDFSSAQDEVLDPRRVRVVEVSKQGFKITLPCRMYERECLDKIFETEITAWVDLTSNRVERLFF
jgi:hypothetical protein